MAWFSVGHVNLPFTPFKSESGSWDSWHTHSPFQDHKFLPYPSFSQFSVPSPSDLVAVPQRTQLCLHFISPAPSFLPSFPTPPYPLFPILTQFSFWVPTFKSPTWFVYSACNSVNFLLNCHLVVSDKVEQNFRCGFYLTNQSIPCQNVPVHSVHIQ